MAGGGVGVRPGAMRRFFRHKLAVSGLVVMALLILSCFIVPVILGHESGTTDLKARYLEPSGKHPFGTDDLGRDVLNRIMLGGQISLLVGLVSALAGTLLGTTIGAVAAMNGGWIDIILMRAADAFLALPVLPLMILLSAMDPTTRSLNWLASHGIALKDVLPPPSLVNILLIVIAFGWMTTARLVRASLLVLKEMEFVLAARVLGASALRIATQHLLPNAMAPILVAVTLAVGRGILYESVLSFLGLGVMPPTPTWGNMLTNAQEAIWKAPWLAIFPGAFIFVTVVSVNFVGDGLRDALDPRSRR
jgi:peptide/nickel transport system permease protein